MNARRHRGLPLLLSTALLAGPAVLCAQTTEDVGATVPEPIVTDRPTDSANYAVALSGAVGGPFSLFAEVYGNFAFRIPH